jgi:carbon storage regulator
MLVLTRRVGESIRVGDGIVVTVVNMGQGKVRIGIQAPPETMILREELLDRNASPPLLMNGPGTDATRTSPSIGLNR